MIFLPKFVCPTFFLTKNLKTHIFFTNISFDKNFFVKNSFLPTFFLPKFFWPIKVFFYQKFILPKILLTKFFFWQIFLSKKFVSKIFLRNSCLPKLDQTFFVRASFWINIFFSWKFFWDTFFEPIIFGNFFGSKVLQILFFEKPFFGQRMFWT